MNVTVREVLISDRLIDRLFPFFLTLSVFSCSFVSSSCILSFDPHFFCHNLGHSKLGNKQHVLLPGPLVADCETELTTTFMLTEAVRVWRSQCQDLAFSPTPSTPPLKKSDINVYVCFCLYWCVCVWECVLCLRV